MKTIIGLALAAFIAFIGYHHVYGILMDYFSTKVSEFNAGLIIGTSTATIGVASLWCILGSATQQDVFFVLFLVLLCLSQFFFYEKTGTFLAGTIFVAYAIGKIILTIRGQGGLSAIGKAIALPFVGFALVLLIGSISQMVDKTREH